jgi:uncharacterized membrane protein
MKTDHLIAVYDTHEEAAAAVKRIVDDKIAEKEDVSVLGMGEEGEPKDSLQIDKENADIVRWGKEGMIWGGVWGFLAGAFFMWVPGFGPLLAAGPIISSLAGALGGAAVLGSLSALVGWFVDLGMEESDAHHYADLVKEGKLLILVHGNADTVAKAKEALDTLPQGEIKVYSKA